MRVSAADLSADQRDCPLVGIRSSQINKLISCRLSSAFLGPWKNTLLGSVTLPAGKLHSPRFEVARPKHPHPRLEGLSRILQQKVNSGFPSTIKHPHLTLISHHHAAKPAPAGVEIPMKPTLEMQQAAADTRHTLLISCHLRLEIVVQAVILSSMM